MCIRDSIAPEQTVTIVTGAPNVYEGMVCPVATEGADLPCGKHITAGELRGVRSCGMLCSGQELGLYEEELKNASVDGIDVYKRQGRRMCQWLASKGQSMPSKNAVKY